jgi:hypothetical protein
MIPAAVARQMTIPRSCDTWNSDQVRRRLEEELISDVVCRKPVKTLWSIDLSLLLARLASRSACEAALSPILYLCQWGYVVGGKSDNVIAGVGRFSRLRVDNSKSIISDCGWGISKETTISFERRCTLKTSG